MQRFAPVTTLERSNVVTGRSLCVLSPLAGKRPARPSPCALFVPIAPTLSHVSHSPFIRLDSRPHAPVARCLCPGVLSAFLLTPVLPLFPALFPALIAVTASPGSVSLSLSLHTHTHTHTECHFAAPSIPFSTLRSASSTACGACSLQSQVRCCSAALLWLRCSGCAALATLLSHTTALPSPTCSPLPAMPPLDVHFAPPSLLLSCRPQWSFMGAASPHSARLDDSPALQTTSGCANDCTAIGILQRQCS